MVAVRRKKPTRAIAREQRVRLRARYREAGEVGLLDHELLELLLTFATPFRDTRILSKKLLERFGTLARVFEAEREAMERVEGVGPQAATLLSLIKPLATKFLKGTPASKNFLRSTGKAAAYFQAKLKGLPEEEVHVAFVNAKNAVTATVRLQRGTADQSAVYVRQVIERSLAHKASGFILAHNHPSGDPTPSAQDRELTQAVKAAAAVVGIRFLDHLIIGDPGPFSFRANGLI